MRNRKARRTGHSPAIRRRTPPGASPGAIVPDPKAHPSQLSAIAFGPDSFCEKPLASPEEASELLDKYPVLWINVDGLGDARVIEQLGEVFGLHRLALEDAVNTHQRAKLEVYGDTLFVVARMADMTRRANTEQLSMFVSARFVLTLQEEVGDCWNPIRDRIRRSAGRFRQVGADYLAYALLDAVIDAYFPLLEQIGDELDQLEDVAFHAGKHVMERMHRVHSELLFLRRAIRPHREAIAELARESTPVITDATRIFLRDCYDHVIQINDLTDTYRELTTDLQNLYLSAVAVRTNEIMRVLTIIATLFMPLSFIAGVYGMNFENMPEIRWPWGYAWAIGLMVVTATTMLSYFYWRGWIGWGSREESRHRDSGSKVG